MATANRKRTAPASQESENSPVGIGVGAVGGVTAGAAAGAAIGSVVPVVGTAIGAVVGAVAGGIGGGFVGNEVGMAIDPKAEEAYWETNYTSRPYVAKEASWTQYRPAYRYGVNVAAKNEERKAFDEVEPHLRRGWGHAHGKSNLAWGEARDAVRDAYNRVIELHAEKLNVGKESVRTGDVKVRKEVVSESKTIQVPVEREEVVIERRAVHGRGSSADIGAETEEIRIPVKEEKVRVSKDVVVNEEVNVKKRKVHGVETVSDDIRHEELKVDDATTGRGAVRRK